MRSWRLLVKSLFSYYRFAPHPIHFNPTHLFWNMIKRKLIKRNKEEKNFNQTNICDKNRNGNSIKLRWFFANYFPLVCLASCVASLSVNESGNFVMSDGKIRKNLKIFSKFFCPSFPIKLKSLPNQHVTIQWMTLYDILHFNFPSIFTYQMNTQVLCVEKL